MREFRAALYKDIKLFMRAAGAYALVLPFILMAIFSFGMGDLSRQTFVQPFPIAIRDEDHTVMSRSLISQVKQVELFSEVRLLDDGISDDQALSEGATGVITIPKDFFYTMYVADDNPASLLCNDDQPLNSALLESIFTSIMDIIKNDQAAKRGLYRYWYGETADIDDDTLYRDTASDLLSDALGRQLVFDTQIEPADIYGALTRRILASVYGMMAVSICIMALRTIPQERDMGILPRWKAMGRRLVFFSLSKFVMSLLFMLPVSILVIFLMPIGESDALTLRLTCAFFLCLHFCLAYLLTYGVTFFCDNAHKVQYYGNLLLLVSLAIGGTFWPLSRMPRLLAVAGKFTPTYHIWLTLESLGHGLSILDVLFGMRYYALFMIIFLLLGCVYKKYCLYGHSKPHKKWYMSIPRTRLGTLTWSKIHGCIGSRVCFLFLLLATMICGYTAGTCQGGRMYTLGICIADEDNSSFSKELIADLQSQERVNVTLCDEREGRERMLSGVCEGFLIIGDGYGESLSADRDIPLHYEASGSSYSSQAMREIIAGKVALQKTYERALKEAGDHISDKDKIRITKYMHQEALRLPDLYTVSSSSGQQSQDPFVPSAFGFSLLFGLLCALELSTYFGRRDSRLVERRMLSISHGRFWSYTTDLLAVWVICFGACELLLLCSGTLMLESTIFWSYTFTTVIYTFTISALSLVVSKITVMEGRVDALSPFAAIILALGGGCFIDLSQLSPLMARVCLISPAGVAMFATRAPMLHGLLILEGIVFALIGLPRRK